MSTQKSRKFLFAFASLAIVVSACSSDAATTITAAEETTEDTSTGDTTTEDTSTGDTSTGDTTTEDTSTEDTSTGDTTTEDTSTGDTGNFTIEVWADNWMGVYIDGTLIGEDSVPITTERSFNSEIFEFEAAYPFTLAIEAKDYIETDSGLEYIGLDNQQIGDGGIIAQVKDASGDVVAVTTGDWRALVIHQAPLNTDCESSADPDADCNSEIGDAPSDWTSVDFDDSAWDAATVWDAAAVDPKIGYDDISWDGSADFLWGSDLQVDNIVLLRTVVSG